ncbi:YHYH protein [Reichenbachiella versicolor]|uniref:YHYH protein n=1 Tax=Reichenbachiella versicolor TaxID=1821036 RepID=UPI000D6DE997|nr:YHYH protein [Reichenbachiella versicolor]
MRNRQIFFLFFFLISSSFYVDTKVDYADFKKIDFNKEYRLFDVKYGTQTIVTLNDSFRVMKTNALPNHPTGNYPRRGNPNTILSQNREYKFPIDPEIGTHAKWVREPGVAVNGVKFEPGTAERFVCETGEVFKIEAFQDLVQLGLDFNNAHVQRSGAYHYHGVPTELIKLLDRGGDIILIGYAIDGFPMYYSKSSQYKPSYVLSEKLRTGNACEYSNPKRTMYKDFNSTQPDGTFVSDWVYKEGYGQLDECNGIEVNGQYAYFVTQEYPYVSRCLKGVFKELHPHRHH